MFCPEGNDRQSPRKIYPKSRFIYHAEKDLYICPANDRLRHVSTVRRSEKSRGHRVYTGANCADCPEKEKCTQAKKGRKIKRYPEDEARDKQRSRMDKPESKRILSQRKVMDDPVFSALRGIQRLERFRRRGLSAVRVEFTLHAIAYNLSRAVALILWAIFSLLWVVSPNNRQSISVGLFSMPVFCDTL
ncbi:transposase, partial [Photorhabdus heterorhabditis]|uniref:transposase n=1 Tax=Photorhabdus heterorhabditis TaxID=880156 RepID=UPI001910984D